MPPERRSRTTLWFSLLVIVFGILLAPRIVQVEKLKSRSRGLETEIKKLHAENLELESQLRLLREDPVYLEKIAREKFNKAKQGEIVYKVVRE